FLNLNVLESSVALSVIKLFHHTLIQFSAVCIVEIRNILEKFLNVKVAICTLKNNSRHTRRSFRNLLKRKLLKKRQLYAIKLKSSNRNKKVMQKVMSHDFEEIYE